MELLANELREEYEKMKMWVENILANLNHSETDILLKDSFTGRSWDGRILWTSSAKDRRKFCWICFLRPEDYQTDQQQSQFPFQINKDFCCLQSFSFTYFYENISHNCFRADTTARHLPIVYTSVSMLPLMNNTLWLDVGIIAHCLLGVLMIMSFDLLKEELEREETEGIVQWFEKGD